MKLIPREDMVNTSKKLPCGHIFHTACLRSWFQRQQTCPTCRLNILRNTNHVQTERPAANNGLDQHNNNNQPNAANANSVPPSNINPNNINVINNPRKY